MGQNYGGSASEIFQDAKQTTDGGYIVLSNSNSLDFDLSGNAGGQDIWVKKLNANGLIEWEQSYGGSDNDISRSIEIDNNGGYIITGYTLSNDGDINGNNGSRDVWVLRIDNTGGSFGLKIMEGLILMKEWLFDKPGKVDIFLVLRVFPTMEIFRIRSVIRIYGL